MSQFDKFGGDPNQRVSIGAMESEVSFQYGWARRALFGQSRCLRCGQCPVILDANSTQLNLVALLKSASSPTVFGVRKGPVKLLIHMGCAMLIIIGFCPITHVSMWIAKGGLQMVHWSVDETHGDAHS